MRKKNASNTLFERFFFGEERKKLYFIPKVEYKLFCEKKRKIDTLLWERKIVILSDFTSKNDKGIIGNKL